MRTIGQVRKRQHPQRGAGQLRPDALDIVVHAPGFVHPSHLAEARSAYQQPEPPIRAGVHDGVGMDQRLVVTGGEIVRECQPEMAEEDRWIVRIDAQRELVLLDRQIRLAGPGQDSAQRAVNQ